MPGQPVDWADPAQEVVMLNRKGITSGCRNHVLGPVREWTCTHHLAHEDIVVHIAGGGIDLVYSVWVDGSTPVDIKPRGVASDDWNEVLRVINENFAYPSDEEVESAAKAVQALLSQMESS